MGYDLSIRASRDTDRDFPSQRVWQSLQSTDGNDEVSSG